MTSSHPLSPPTDIVVVGASATGLTVVETLRRDGYEGRLTLVGDERHAPYDRPPLSKQLLSGRWPAERLALRGPQELDRLGVDLLLNTKATGLDPASRQVTLSTGRVLGYDRLVIATGVTPRRLPGTEGLSGVHTLRTLDDAQALARDLVPGSRLVVAGGGFLGTEVASVARERGVDVALVEPAAGPLAAAVGSDVGDFVADLHRAHGVRLHIGAGAQVHEVEARDGRVAAVVLADGSRLPADTLLVAIGSTPAVGWLRDSGLRCDDGVHCDERCAAAPGVYAAGDVARWRHPRYGELRIEHRTNAAEQGVYVARALLSEPVEPFAPVPYFWSDQYDVKIQSFGWLRGHDTVRVVEGSLDEGRFVALYAKDGLTTGVLGVNSARALGRWRPAVAARELFPASTDTEFLESR